MPPLAASPSPSLPPPTAGSPRSGFPTPNSPTPQTITHTHHTAPNSTTEHCTTTSQHPTTILPLYILHSLTHLLTTPSSCSSNPPPPNPPETLISHRHKQTTEMPQTAAQSITGQLWMLASVRRLTSCWRSLVRASAPSPGRSTGPEMACVLNL